MLHVLVVVACLLLFELAPPTPSASYAITSATLVEGGESRPVSLPFLLHSNFTMTDPPVFETGFQYRPTALKEPWAIMLPRFGNAVEVRINGQIVLDTRLDPVANRHLQNPSVIATIPDTMLREGHNDLSVRLFVWGPLRGYLDCIFIGPRAELSSSYRLRNFLFSTLPMIFKAWQAMLALILGIMWLNRRHDVAYGVLACTMMLGFVQGLAVTPLVKGLHANFDILLASTTPLETALMFVFIVLYFRGSLPRWTPVLFLPSLVMVIGAIVGDPALLRWLYALVGVTSGALILSLCLGFLARIALQRGDAVSLTFSCAITAIITAWAYDMLVAIDVLGHGRIFLARLSYSFLLVAIGAGLTWRFAHALNEVDNFANRMVDLVREAEEKVRASFAREEERSRAMTLAAERSRLTRDLHDGLGGQLMSIVALSEREAGGGRINEAARAALRELRLVIDAMDDMGGDLLLALGSWRERAQAQLRSHGIQLDWQAEQQGLPLHPELRPWHVIQIVRILDEAITNAARHAGASRVLVRLGSEAPPVEDHAGADDANEGQAVGGQAGTTLSSGWITVSDDGRGLPSRPYPGAPVRQGRGLANMRTRAAMCGVRFRMVSGNTGTMIRLDLPVVFPPTPQA